METLTKCTKAFGKLFDARTKVLKNMLESEQESAFKQKEASQDAPFLGGGNIQAVSRGDFDLTRFGLDELVPRPGIPQGEPSKMAEGGIVGTQPFFRAPYIPGPGEGIKNVKPKSLQESGFDDALYNKIDKQFQKDNSDTERIKRAFDQALRLPAQAGIAALLDAIKNASVNARLDNEGAKTSIKNNFKKVADAFKLPASLPMKEGVDEDDDDSGAKKRDWFEMLIQMGITGAMRLFSGNRAAKDSGPMGDEFGSNAPTKELAWSGDAVGMGDPPLWSGRQDMGYGGSLMGDGKGRGVQSATKDFGAYAAALGGLGGGGGGTDALTEQAKVKTFGGTMAEVNRNWGFIGNEGVNYRTEQDHEGVYSVKDKIDDAISSFEFKTEGPKVNLTELTDNVIADNAASRDNKASLSLMDAPIAVTGDVSAPGGSPAGGGGNDTGSIALPKIKPSPYFLEYNKTSQF